MGLSQITSEDLPELRNAIRQIVFDAIAPLVRDGNASEHVAFTCLDAGLVDLEPGAAAFAGLGSAFLRGARVFFVASTGSAVRTSTGVLFTAAMVSSAMLCFSRSMFGNSFRRQKCRSMVDVIIRPCTSCVQDEIDLLSGHIDQIGHSVEC